MELLALSYKGDAYVVRAGAAGAVCAAIAGLKNMNELEAPQVIVCCLIHCSSKYYLAGSVFQFILQSGRRLE